MKIRSLFGCVMVVAATACQANEPATPAAPPALLTTLPRSLSAPEQTVINADNQLGFDLLRRAQAETPDSNILLSPLSAGMALGMTLNGAAGTTLDSMRIALQLGNTPVADINAGYHSLIGLLASLDPTTTFNIANSIWADSTLAVLSSFLTADQTNFGAEVFTQNLQATATVGAINAWVNQKTNGKIPTIVKSIPPTEVMLLINAIYFKGAWRQAFDSTQTQAAPFTPVSGSTQSVPTMTLGGTVGYFVTTDAELVELPYGNGAYAMTIILPGSGRTIADLVNEIDATHFAGWVASMVQIDLGLTLPKFTFAYTRALNDDLSALGMRRAFDSSAADFSAMATLKPDERLYLSGVTQKTLIDVNESGTVAAAVTSVGVARASSRAIEVDVNRPFLFVLRERLSGTIFFVGQVNRIP